MTPDFEFCVIGGGVIGLAIARELSQHSHDVLLIEQHEHFGSETSSRNSEVIHAGLYYPVGSLKERLCLQGKQALYQFCEQFQIPYRQTGKLIVSQLAEDNGLTALYDKARSLNIPVRHLNQADIHALEPQVQAQQGLLSSTTGIIDSHAFMQALLHQTQQQQATCMTQTKLIRATSQTSDWRLKLRSVDEECEFSTRVLINAAGLSAQRIAQSLDVELSVPVLHPCRGHYFSYAGASPFQHLIYPMPEPALAGLGIHATLDLNQQVRFGPDVEFLPSDAEYDYEVSPMLQPKFCEAIRSYFPAIDEDKLQPDYAGIRPKLSGLGDAAEDFVIQTTQDPVSLHLFGIESPGLTASLAIAQQVRETLIQ